MNRSAQHHHLSLVALSGSIAASALLVADSAHAGPKAAVTLSGVVRDFQERAETGGHTDFEADPTGHALAAGTAGNPYFNNLTAGTVAMAADAIEPVGGGRSHTNLMPYLCVHFIIALFGIYPSRD